MPSLTIRNIPEHLMEDLRRIAKRERRSVNAQAIYCLEEATQSHRNLARRARVVKEINALREEIHRRHGLGSDSTELIRRMRNERAKA
jgi:hypothetical protein